MLTIKKTEPANFETAVLATGYGKFNVLLMLLIFPTGWANSFASVTMSYVFPAAQCDLNLTLQDKGLLNAITYSGMISSAVLWGFLFDTLGRKKLLVVGYLLNFFCILISAASQTKEMLIAGKFFEGFIINGPYAALSTYISEFHSAQNRGRMQLFIAVVFCLGGLALPWTAFAILTNNQLKFTLFEGTLKFQPWNILLLICSLPSLFSFIIFIFMPESPKFLMTIGENEKALKLFRKMYSINNKQSPKDYPIQQLVDEIELKKSNPNLFGSLITPKRNQIKALREGWQQIKPLFCLPYLPIILLVCGIQTLFTMNVNTLRLWLPQIFQALNDFSEEESGDLCQALDMIQPTNSTECSFNVDNAPVYLNQSIFNIIVLLCEVSAVFIVIYVRKTLLLFVLGVLSGICVFVLYFSRNIIFAVAFSALYTGLGAVAANIIVVVIIDLFPTTLRTMSLSLSLMCGRIGSMIGNLVFPILIQTGCAAPFFTCGSLIIVAAVLALFLPNSDQKDLL